MLVSLKNVFSPQSIAQTFQILDPLQSTIMDTLFKQRPNHPSPRISYAEVKTVLRSVPVVRRDGSPIPIGNEELEVNSFAPLPIKVSTNVSASELNDLGAMFGNPMAIVAWRTKKIEELRRAARITTEAMATIVATTGKISWPVELKGGRTTTYEIDFGAIPTLANATKITQDTKVSELYRIFKSMRSTINHNGYGGKITFFAGEDVFSILLDICDAPKTQTKESSMRIELSAGKINIGGFEIIALDETYPAPDGTWVQKLNPKMLLAVATDIDGRIYYCALDSVSANNAPLPMHIIPKVNDDDSGVTLIGQSKPAPLRPSEASCMWQAVV